MKKTTKYFNIINIILFIVVLTILFYIIDKLCNNNVETFYAGNTNSQEKLNNTLVFISKLLNENNIKNWFIGYGTLLGIIRGNSCIEGDDDIDIICNVSDREKIKIILNNNGLKLNNVSKSNHIMKTEETNKYSSIDFYTAKIDNNGGFQDNWEKVLWSNCYKDNKLIELKWKETYLYLPNNYEEKLVNRYGEKWRTPQKTKGPTPRKKVI